MAVISRIEKNKILLQTCSVKAKSKNNMMIILLLDTISIKNIVLRSVSIKLQLKVIQKENFLVFNFGNKQSIKKNFLQQKLS